MKIRMLWGAFFAVMLLASVASAEVIIHKVEKGETLSSISLRHKVKPGDIKKMNSCIESIHVIKIGWSLIIPSQEMVTAMNGASDGVEVKNLGDVKIEKKKPQTVSAKKLLPVDIYIPGEVGVRQGMYSTENIGRAPTKMVLEKAFSKLLLPERVKAKLKVMVAEGRGVDGFIEPEDKFLMTYGSDGVFDATLKHHSNLAATQYLFELDGIIYDVRFIWYCKNWTRYQEKKKIVSPPIVPETPKVKSPPVDVPPGIEMIIPPITKAPPAKWKTSGPDNWDWYVGAGNYRSRIEGDDNHSHYEWTKYRNRPLWYKPDENSLGIKNIGFGFVGFLSGGEGIAAKHYDYKWKEAALGLTTKVYAKNSDYDFDAMMGRLWNEGTWMGTGGNKQVDDFILLSAHGNFYRELDDPESKWFKKSELNGEGRFPFRTKVKRGEKANNRVIEANYVQWIYEFNLGENDSFNLSPGFNLGGGYEWSNDDEAFAKTGPAIELASYNNVIAGISVMNYKFQGKGQWHPISGYVSIDGTWRAYEASQITGGISEKELNGLEGSKVLVDPAKYL